MEADDLDFQGNSNSVCMKLIGHNIYFFQWGDLAM